MLPKDRKLRDKRIFADIFKSGGRFFGRLLTVYTTEINGPSRFACVVSLKVSKSAVLRNMLRRRGFSLIGKYILNIKSGYAVVIVFKQGALNVDIGELEKDILSIFKKAQLLV